MVAASPTPPSRNGTPSKKFGPRLLLGTAAVAIFIGLWEGGKGGDGSSVAYADELAGGLPTVCAGLTRHITTTPIVVGQRWSAEKCLSEEQKAITAVQLQLEKCFHILPPQSVFDAATSHAWNNGAAATCGSLAMQAWNAGNWELGCRRLAFSDGGSRVWSYVRTGNLLPNGKPEYRFVRGLANRRDAEHQLCLTGIQP
jgi:lysozyme